MSYDYEDELERMKKRRQQRRRRESDFISAHQEEFENRKIRHSKAIRRKRRRKRIFLIVEILALFILASVIFSVIRDKKDNGYWTIAVFGVDSRDGKLGKGALSDVEMICNINKATGEIQLVSVFRDTYLKISPDGEYHKINEAYFKGGPSQAVNALEENLDLQIDSYATFNWKAVVDAINILGGIDLEITDSEFAYINSFITETVNSTGVGSYQLDHAGMNHLDGVQAVAYARLRLMDTDFNRTARQRKVVELAMEKAKQADWSVRYNILVTVLPQISTDIGIDDLIPMAKQMGDYHITETTGFPFSRTTMKIDRRDCVVATTLESNVIQLHQLLFGDENYTPSSEVKKISKKISELSGISEPGENAPAIGTGGGTSSNKPQTPQETTPEPTEEPSTEEETSAEETVEETESIEETSTEEAETNEENFGPGTNLGPANPVTPDSPLETTPEHTSEPSEKPTASVQPESSAPVEKPTEPSAVPSGPESPENNSAENVGPGVM